MPPIPAGWKLVPIEPTDEMVKAAFDQFEISAPGFATGKDARRAIYAAMLAAAPSPASVPNADRDWELTCDHCDGDGFDIYGAKPEFARAIESALLSKLRAPVSDIREGFELTYGADADDPACASDLTHFTNGWRACIMSQVRAPVADERAAFEAAMQMRGQNVERWPNPHGGYRSLSTEIAWYAWNDRAALASAPVAGEAQKPVADACFGGVIWRDGVNIPERPIPFYAAPQARPSDDELWDQTLAERDEYHDIADKLADAIADHLLVEIGEHSSSNCPWMRALDAIQNAAPQASEAVRDVEDAERWRWATASDGNADKLCSIVLCHGGYQDKINERADFYRAALSAQPAAEPLSNPKQFALTAADERTAFEATYQADYDDPGAACEREHFGKGYRAGLAAQSGAQRTGGSDGQD